MNILESYVDDLFKGYKESKQIKELKDEILSNLEAKVSDLTSNGMDYKQAVKVAKESIKSIDYLIEDNKKVYINKLKVELLQMALIYFLMAWIITIPLRIVREVVLLNLLLFVVVIVLGALFFIVYSKEKQYLQEVSSISFKSAIRNKKLSWIVCGLFILIAALRTTAVHFASNIWFSRPIRIDGPYRLAVLAVEYLLPFILIAIPLLFSDYLRLLKKYEVGELNED